MIINKIKAFIELIRVPVVLAGIISVFIGGIVNGLQYATFDLFIAIVAVFFMTAGSMAFNDYFDLKIDKVVHSKRPIPSGRITIKESLYFSISSFIIASLLSYYINLLCFGIVIISIFLIALYEIYLKNQGLFGNMIVAITCSMAFAFGGASINEPLKGLILSIITSLLILGREILMDVRDMDGDKLFRITLPMKIGKKPASYIGFLISSFAVILAPLPVIWGILSSWYLIIFIFVGILIAYSIIISFKDLQNVSKTANLLKLTIAIVFFGFLVGILF